MKWKALILLMSFAVLIFNPSFGKKESTTEQHACCQKTVSKDHCATSNSSDSDTSDNESDCCNNGCNPFVNCCGFMGFVVVEPFSITVTDVQSIQVKMDFYQSIAQSYNASIWEPPRV